MTVRWRRVLPILSPFALVAIAFSAYTYSRPTTYCVIVNESLQTTVKASGERCTALSSEEKAVVFTPDGVHSVSDCHRRYEHYSPSYSNPRFFSLAIASSAARFSAFFLLDPRPSP